MDNYKIHKIKLADRKASEQVQELLNSVGLKWSTKEPQIIHPFQYPLNLFINWKEEKYFSGYDSRAEEIDLAQLYDFVLSERIKREINDPALISGADAMIAAINGKDVEYEWIEGSGNWRSFNDEEWSAEDLKSGGYKFRLKPTTIKVNAELPKPQKETQHNSLVYAVTYEFKSREERNAFADKLRGTNS